MSGGDEQIVRWHPLADAGALRREATRRVLAAASEAISARGRFRLVLAGGNTPRATYAALCDAQADWPYWEIFFGDERCLPVDDAERNSKMANDAWLAQVPIAPERIHAIPAEFGADAAARAYAQTLRDVGEFDLVLLGLGEDGHTASLFPDHDRGAGDAAPDTLAVFDAPKPPPQRVSLSAARLGRSRQVLFLVDGESKRDAVTRWRAGEDIPARAIRPAAGVDALVEASLLTAPPCEGNQESGALPGSVTRPT